MAGNWIKWTKGLPDKPEVVRLAGLLGLPREAAVCRLMKFWEWCDDVIADSDITATGSAFVILSPRDGDNAAFVDALVGTPKFADSLAAVGWIRFRSGRVELPNFGRHNGETAKTRARNANNQKKKRNGDAPPSDPAVTKLSPEMSPPSGDKTVTRGEERRRKETSPSEMSAAVAAADPPEPKKPRPPPDGPHHRCVRVFCGAWEARYGKPYVFGGGKDADAVRAVLAGVGGDEAEFARAVAAYFACRDAFVVEQVHSLGLFRSQINRWRAGGVATPPQAVRPIDMAMERVKRVMAAKEAAKRQEGAP